MNTIHILFGYVNFYWMKNQHTNKQKNKHWVVTSQHFHTDFLNINTVNVLTQKGPDPEEHDAARR